MPDVIVMVTHYDILGVISSATTADIRRAYLALARRHHPDAGGDDESMRRLNDAYGVLADPRRRRAYDLQLGHVLIGEDPPSPADDRDEDDEDRWIDQRDLDDEPLHAPVRGHGLLATLPVVVFLLSILIGCIGLVIDVPAVIAVAFTVFVISVGLMVLVPVIVMGRGR